MAQQTHEPLLEVRSISKRFPGILALDNVHLKLHPAQILAVIGENGAGKTTLMKILGGVLTTDTGQVLLNNKKVSIDSVSTATKLGIALIHQELNLSENQLSSLPAEIWQLKNLTTLSLSCNQFSSLPPEIGQLQNLTDLYLSQNQELLFQLRWEPVVRR